MQISEAQAALFWELRAALSLARLKANRGDPSCAARTILEPIYVRFSKQVQTSDLRAAASILKAVGSTLV
jgi:hypothetical protein